LGLDCFSQRFNLLLKELFLMLQSTFLAPFTPRVLGVVTANPAGIAMPQPTSLLAETPSLTSLTAGAEALAVQNRAVLVRAGGRVEEIITVVFNWLKRKNATQKIATTVEPISDIEIAILGHQPPFSTETIESVQKLLPKLETIFLSPAHPIRTILGITAINCLEELLNIPADTQNQSSLEIRGLIKQLVGEKA
jgi:hypothetical protein